MKKFIHITIHGRVQGVGFRYHLAKEAEKHGVAGWCKNREDGAVECEAEGEAKALDALASYCRRGPFFAKVERVECANGDRQEEKYTNFQIM